MSIKDFFKEASGQDQAILEASDYLVEQGVPREIAERSCQWAFEFMESLELKTKLTTCWNGNPPDMYERTVRRYLALGALMNYIEPKALLSAFAVQAAYNHYQTLGE